ncbi:sugar porter family MFS transporter [Aeoliella sp.]|uniref:sugar porter family MFS transporter n=1 Tax=Aeoliella sp. TaxID=2795800 RepID=UPI003CCC1803
MQLSRTLVTSAIVAALGGLLFGFDTVVISGAEQQLEELFAPAANLSAWWGKFWHGFLMASALIGTVVGSVLVAKPSDRLGRRGVMFYLALLFFVSALGSALAWDWYSLVFFRFIGGLGVGGASVVSPMYIAEISPAAMRGRLVAVTQFNIVLGILLAYLSNLAIASLDFGATEWRWMFGVECAPAAAYFLLLFSTPRSPRWLVAKGRDEEARSVLEQVGIDQSAGTVDDELAEIKKSIDLEHHNLEEPFFQAKYFKPILLAFAIAAFNQLSGINAVLYYSRRIFEYAGFGESAGLMNSVGLGVVNLVFTIVGMALIDRAGRRKLLIVGSIGYIVTLGATAWAFYTQRAADGSFTGLGSQVVLVSLLAFIASHAVGQGAVIWVFIGEIFPNRLRGRGQAFGSFTHWIFAAAISQTFPLIADVAGGAVFAFYAVCMVGQLIWVLTAMPETKGVPLEKIQEQMGIE